MHVSTINMAYTQVFGLFNNYFLIVTALIAAGLATVLTRYYFAAKRPKNFPAWPSNLPVPGKSTPPAAVEELLKVQSSARKLSVQSHMLITSRFDEWAKEFGSIVGLKFGPQNVVILNTYHHVKE
jgi:hypothetical protein